jgi:hypothetical protein
VLTAILLVLFGPDPMCFFVDQTDGAVALVRNDDGVVDWLRTTAPEGSRVCPHGSDRPTSRVLPHRTLSPGGYTLEQLQE